MNIEEKVDNILIKSKNKLKKNDLETIEIMPGVKTLKDNVEFFIDRMFDPEGNIWIWIRRIANICSIPTLIICLIIIGVLIG